MNTTIESLHEDIMDLKRDMSFIKSVLSEDFELSEHAKAELEAARKTPESEYIDLVFKSKFTQKLQNSSQN